MCHLLSSLSCADAFCHGTIPTSHFILNEKALKCKPSVLIFGCGRAKKSIALQGYNIGIHMKEARAVACARGFDKAHALTKM